MEVEQFADHMPRAVYGNTGVLNDWHRDPSGPMETTIGPYKNAKSLLNLFYRGTRDEGNTWDWRAASALSGRASGAGSHVHLCLDPDVFEDTLAGWTIAYNTVVELFPVFAPFFCHDWKRGFRHGTTSSSGLSIRRWADGTLRRYSQNSMERNVTRPSSFNRSYKSVTLSPRRHSKPMTVELRANDAHPVMALLGALALRRVTGRMVEREVSPKFENSQRTKEDMYEKIYERATSVGLLTAMQEPLELTFEEGRGIPSVDRRRFDSMFDLLRAIQMAYPYAPSWRSRGYKLVGAGDDDHSPMNNPNALWAIDAAKGEFDWDSGLEASY